MPPPSMNTDPEYPFQSVCMDFFTESRSNYLAVVDGYSNWLSIFKLPANTSKEININITSKRSSSKSLGNNPQSPLPTIHVETSKQKLHKSAKRLLRGNISQTWTLDTDELARDFSPITTHLIKNLARVLSRGCLDWYSGISSLSSPANSPSDRNGDMQPRTGP